MIAAPWYTHHALSREYSLDFTIVSRSPLRIGSGRAKSPKSPIDLQVERILVSGVEAPYLPGSSLKGVFRSTAEYVARSSGVEVCMMGEGCREKFDDELQRALRHGSVNNIISLLDKYCLICKIFGSASFKSHLHFEDAYPEKPANTTVGVKTGVAIDRRSGAVKHRALYTVEFVEPGNVFRGKFQLYNTPNYAVGLLAKVVEAISLGFVALGGFKSRGFGRVEMTLTGFDGTIVEGSQPKPIGVLAKIPALDQLDIDVEYSPDPNALLKRFSKVWDSFAEKHKS